MQCDYTSKLVMITRQITALPHNFTDGDTMAQTQWQRSCGAIIFHAIQLQKNIDTKDRFIRLKTRVIELEMLLDEPAEVKKKFMTVREAVEIVYDKLPLGQFSGTKLSEQVRFLTGRNHMHNDSALRVLRLLRELGIINFVSIDCKQKSLYQKLEV